MLERQDMGDEVNPVPSAAQASWTRRAAQWSLVAMFFAFPISVALANVTMALAVLLWFVSMRWADWKPFFAQAWRNPVAKPAVLLALLVVVATFWSPATGPEIVGYFKKYSKFLFLPVFMALLVQGEVRQRCWQAFGVAMLITLVSTWLNVWIDLPWSQTRNQGFGVDHTVFKDHIAQGIMMSLFVCLTAMWAIKAVVFNDPASEVTP